MPVSHAYRPEPRFLDLGGEYGDAVLAADFPLTTLRFRNDHAAASVGLDSLTDAEWIAYFDQTGLYAFARQPEAVFWNLTQLAGCLKLVADAQALTDALNDFGPAYIRELRAAFLNQLGVQSLGEAADQRLLDTTLALLREGGAALRWEPLFHDWFGGFASSARALSGPRAAIYQGEAFDAFRFALFEHAPDRPERLEAPMFAAAEPEEMLVDEVEAIWAAIARANDWSLFSHKLRRLEALRNVLET